MEKEEAEGGDNVNTRERVGEESRSVPLSVVTTAEQEVEGLEERVHHYANKNRNLVQTREVFFCEFFWPKTSIILCLFQTVQRFQQEAELREEVLAQVNSKWEAKV